MGPNPYTWFTMETLRDTWRSLQKAIKDREADLQSEKKRQEENDVLRQQFAQLASEFYRWLTDTRNDMMEIGSTVSSLEQQLVATRQKLEDIRSVRPQFKRIEDLSSRFFVSKKSLSKTNSLFIFSFKLNFFNKDWKSVLSWTTNTQNIRRLVWRKRGINWINLACV
jgi:hypothetical protein